MSTITAFLIGCTADRAYPQEEPGDVHPDLVRRGRRPHLTRHSTVFPTVSLCRLDRVVLEVLLDPGVLEERVHGDLEGVPGDHLGLIGPVWSWVVGPRVAPVAGEDQLHGGRGGPGRGCRRPGLRRTPERGGGRRTRWCGRSRSGASTAPTSSRPARSAAVKRQWQHAHPAVEEHWISPGPSRSQIACKPAGSSQEANPLDSSVNPTPAMDGLAFGPLVAVDPHLDRIREVGAHLDERRPEIGVPQVEVEARDPPVGLGEREPRRVPLARCRRDAANTFWNSCATPIAATPDRPVASCAARWRRITSILRSALLNATPALGCARPRRTHSPHAGTRCRSSPRSPATESDTPDAAGHERHHLTAHLQGRHIAVEIDPIQTLEIQRHVSIKQIVHRHRLSHDHSLRRTRATQASPRLGGQRRSLISYSVRGPPRATSRSAPDLMKSSPRKIGSELGGSRGTRHRPPGLAANMKIS